MRRKLRRSSAAVATSREGHRQQSSGREVLRRRWGRVCKKRHSRSVLVQKLTGIESNGPNANGCHFWFSPFAVAKACTHYRRRSQRLSSELRCLDVPHGTSCCGIFATLGEYFCPITLLGDFPVRMSQLEHVGGRAHGCRDDSIDCDSGVRCRFFAGPLGHQARPFRRCEIEEGTVSDFTSAPEPGVLVGHDAPEPVRHGKSRPPVPQPRRSGRLSRSVPCLICALG